MKYISSLNIQDSNKSLVIFNDSSCSFFKELNEKLNGSLSGLKGFEKINTLGSFKFKNIYLATEKSAKEISNIKEDFIILFDSFPKTINSINFISDILSNTYEFTKYKKGTNKSVSIEIHSEKDITIEVQEAIIIAEAINTCKDLVNTPHCDMNAHNLADHAISISDIDGIETTIIDKSEIEKLGMGAYLSVANGSLLDPKLITLKYQGKKTWDNPTALVGKGVMYDTGGYSLKLSGNMANMKSDMGGSAVVISAIEAIAKLKLEQNILVVIAATDNSVNEKATYPDDVVKSMKGLTIEVNNTDAEGRLTLCDAITFAQKEGCKTVIDIATLTGGVITALGNDITGAFTNSDELLSKVKNASVKSEEMIWELPVEQFRKQVRTKSKIADLHNSPGRAGHASFGAAFLREFIEEGTNWVHLDIAGVATKDTMATGKMVRTIINLMK